MREKLEFKILGFGLAILVVGVILTSTLVALMVRANIYDLARDRIEGTTKVVTKSIEGTMLDGEAKVTKSLTRDLKNVGGFEGIEVYNREGKEAFKKDAPATELEALDRLASTDQRFSYKKGKNIVFYMPLRNVPSCQICHLAEGKILGAVKVVVSVEKEYERIMNFILLVALGSFFGIVALGSVFWWILRRFVINPVKALEKTALKMAGGDLYFDTGITTRDEIGRLDKSIKESLGSVSNILRRVKEISKRISNITDMVENDSGKVVRSTQLESEAVGEISSSMEQLNAAITEIADSTESLAASVQETAASMEEMASSITSVTNITRDLSDEVDGTASSVEELSTAITEVASGAMDLSRVSDETLSAVEVIINSIREVETRAKESARLSEKVAEDASSLGVTAMNKTMDGMQRIKTSFEGTASAIEKLGVRSDDIGKILNVIDEITDQTTLLALNAAILAAQAGEHGRGFSVVAGEIKDLAERTAFSTQEISQLIQSVRQEVKDTKDAMKEGLGAVDEGIVLSRDASGALRKILESSRMSSEVVISIERSTGEQAKTAKLVSNAINNVRSMVGQIASATAEQSREADRIKRAIEKMREAFHQVDIATEQQAAGSRQISKTVEIISEKSQQISRAIYEQKMGSNQIWSSLAKMKDLPEENRDLAFSINKALQELLMDADLVNTEMQRFRLYEERDVNAIRMGVVPLEAPAEMFRRFTPLAEYLGRELRMRVDLKVAQDYTSAVRDLGSGETQLCYMTPLTYIQAHMASDAELLVKALRDGRPYHHAVIVTKEDSAIKSLKDLRGRSFAFGDINSTSGHIVPRAMLLEEGVELKDLTRHRFLGHHDDVVKEVLKGEFDAGCVRESLAEKFKDEGLRFLKVSREIPEFNICARGLNGEDKAAVKTALLRLTDGTSEGALILGNLDRNYTGFTEAKNEDYDGVKTMMSKIGML